MTEPTPPTQAVAVPPAVPPTQAIVPVATRPLYDGIGAKRCTQDQQEIFEAPAKESDLDILPTGEVYLSQVQFRRRLNKAFGVMGWGLRALGVPIQKDNQCIQQFALVAEDRFIAQATGQATYYPQNSRMGWGDALEACKSNALMRCCKDLGIASECWDHRYTEQFKRDQCVKVCRKSQRNQWQWRRRDAPPFEDEVDSPANGTLQHAATMVPEGSFIHSKFPGKCRVCELPFQKGERVWFVKGEKGVLCESCTPHEASETHEEIPF